MSDSFVLGEKERENKSKIKKMQSLTEVALLTVRNAVEAMITINHKGRIEGFNPAAERLFGYTAAEIIGQNVHRLVPTPHNERHDQYICAYMLDRTCIDWYQRRITSAMTSIFVPT